MSFGQCVAFCTLLPSNHVSEFLILRQSHRPLTELNLGNFMSILVYFFATVNTPRKQPKVFYIGVL
jgi:hypothetical protein